MGNGGSGGLTVVGHGVDPLVERRVELRDDVLLPLLADEPEERLRLVDRVLSRPSPSSPSALHPKMDRKGRDADVR